MPKRPSLQSIRGDGGSPPIEDPGGGGPGEDKRQQDAETPPGIRWCRTGLERRA
jgi:hypothetical protein